MPDVLVTRRDILAGAGGACLAGLALARTVPLHIGVTDWNLKLSADPESVAEAAELGFQGVQVSFRRQVVDDKMPADRPDLIERYLTLSRQHRVAIDGTCVDRLHDNGLKSDPLAAKWVSDSIRLTKDLKTRVLLLPFFGRWAIQADVDKQRVGDALRELAPEAEKAGVVLGLEDTISAEDNVRIMDRSRAKNVLVYYDVGNSTLAGFDVVKEIRWLGRDRICQFHFKDNPHFLGEGEIQFTPIVDAIRDIGWGGWVNLETDAHPNNLAGDMRRNLAYVRKVVDQAYA